MIDPTTHRTISERSYHGATSRSSMQQMLSNDILKAAIYIPVYRKCASKMSSIDSCELIVFFFTFGQVESIRF